MLKNEYLEKDGECYYCGNTATTKDHLTPVSYIYNTGNRRKKRYFLDKKNLVPCCSQCNSIANDLMFDSVEEKREHIQERLKSKYRKLLNMPEWTDEEIDEMGTTFQVDLRITMMAKKWMINRISYPDIIYEERLKDRSILDILSVYTSV